MRGSLTNQYRQKKWHMKKGRSQKSGLFIKREPQTIGVHFISNISRLQNFLSAAHVDLWRRVRAMNPLLIRQDGTP